MINTNEVNMNLLVVDDTEHMCGMPKEILRAFAIYAYLPDTAVHCCEITPSHEMIFVGKDAELADGISDEKREELLEWIDEAYLHNEDVRYYHVSSVRTMTKIKFTWAMPTGKKFGVVEEYSTIDLEELDDNTNEIGLMVEQSVDL